MIAPKQRPTILVIEDNPGDIYLLRKALGEADVDAELLVFEDGAQATAFARTSMATPPHLIVLDLNLPKKSGAEVLRLIRGIESLANLPVYILTSSASPQEAREAKSLGVQEFITKPMDFAGFLQIAELMKRALEGSPTRQDAGSGA